MVAVVKHIGLQCLPGVRLPLDIYIVVKCNEIANKPLEIYSYSILTTASKHRVAIYCCSIHIGVYIADWS